MNTLIFGHVLCTLLPIWILVFISVNYGNCGGFPAVAGSNLLSAFHVFGMP